MRMFINFIMAILAMIIVQNRDFNGTCKDSNEIAVIITVGIFNAAVSVFQRI